jgi:hypothetical protein
LWIENNETIHQFYGCISIFLFFAGVHTGINFARYDTIKVEVTGPRNAEIREMKLETFEDAGLLPKVRTTSNHSDSKCVENEIKFEVFLIPRQA